MYVNISRIVHYIYMATLYLIYGPKLLLRQKFKALTKFCTIDYSLFVKRLTIICELPGNICIYFFLPRINY